MMNSIQVLYCSGAPEFRFGGRVIQQKFTQQRLLKNLYKIHTKILQILRKFKKFQIFKNLKIF